MLCRGVPLSVALASLLLALALTACTTPAPATPAPVATTPAAATVQAAFPTTPTAGTPAAGVASSPVATALPSPSANTGTAPAAASASAGVGRLRQADWQATLAKTPGLMLEKGQIPGVEGPYLRYETAKVAGYPLFASVVYGDIGGDAEEEAIIPLASGGTAGNVGFLVFKAGADAPQLVGAGGGYKQGLRVSEGALLASSAVYAGWEANCCPSATEITRYKVQEGTLARLDSRLEPFEEAKVMTVEQFYGLLAQKEYRKAYAFFAPAFQQANPFDRWAAGYDGMKGLEYTVKKNPDGSVGVELDTQEVEQGGAQGKHHYSGRWLLTFSPEAKQWHLQRAEISRIR